MTDDLGCHDVGWRNSEQAQTPALHALVKAGVEIPRFYVYKMCAPSRASVLSGRYPFQLGLYANNGGFAEGVNLNFTLLPQLLKGGGYKTHAWANGTLSGSTVIIRLHGAASILSTEALAIRTTIGSTETAAAAPKLAPQVPTIRSIPPPRRWAEA